MLGREKAMKHIRLITALFFIIILHYPAFSATHNPSNDEANIINKANNYLNNLKNISAKLKQLNGNGSYVTGELYIKNRDNIRIDYKKPNSSSIIYDGRRIIHIDKEIDEVSFISANSTPFSFLLNQKKKIDLRKDFLVAKIKIHKNDGRIFIFLLPKNFSSKQNDEHKTIPDFQLILTFKPDNRQRNKDIMLDSWTLIEGNNQYTRVELSDIKNNAKLDKSMFRYQRSTL